MSRLLLIDGNSIMNRGYFALPKSLTSPDGLHTNAILGFLNIFFKIIYKSPILPAHLPFEPVLIQDRAILKA